jgi:hypothetical protein
MDARTGAAAQSSRRLFLPSKRALLSLAMLGLSALGAALFLRYGVIQNTPIGLACEAGVCGTWLLPWLTPRFL